MVRDASLKAELLVFLRCYGFAMAFFSRSRARAYKILYRFHSDCGCSRLKISPLFWSRREALSWFDDHVDVGDDIVEYQIVQGSYILDSSDAWFIDYYGLREHDVFPYGVVG